MADASAAKTTKAKPSSRTIEVLSPASPSGGTKKVKLDADVFGAEFNGPLVHEVVVAELAARRRGTAATRTRGLVRGGGAKPWRQKGTGRARQGTIRAPQFAGGGVVFGPSPRHYTVKVNRKARRAALRCALSVHADRGSVFALDAGGFDEPSTKQAADVGGRLDGRARRRHRARTQEGGGCLMDASQVIIRPVVSEKSYALATVGKYTFRVHQDAHKTQIKQAVEQLFDVRVVNVATSSVPSKPKRRGYTSGRTRAWKKAVIQLSEGDSIPIFQGLEADL